MQVNKYYKLKIVEKLIIKRLFSCSSMSEIETSEFDYDYWSIIFKAKGNCDSESFYIKIPKKEWKEKNIGNIIKNKNDIKFALEEWKSLNFIYKYQKTNNIKYFAAIEPVDYFDEYNTIITREFKGVELYEYARCNNKIIDEDRSLGLYFYYIGKWLSKFHKETNKIIPGFEIRNILINDASKQLAIIDPGEIKKGNPYQDVARLIATTMIVYWGTINFCLGYNINNFYIKKFLEGYGSYDNELLRKYILDNFNLLQKDAYQVLEFKKYPVIFKFLIKKYYIDKQYYELRKRNQAMV